MNPVVASAMVKYRLNGRQINALRALRLVSGPKMLVVRQINIYDKRQHGLVKTPTLDALARRGLAYNLISDLWRITAAGIEASHGI